MAVDYIFQLGTTKCPKEELDLNNDCFKGDIYFDYFEQFQEDNELLNIIKESFFLPEKLVSKSIKNAVPFDLTLEMRNVFLAGLDDYVRRQFAEAFKLITKLIVKPDAFVLQDCLNCVSPKCNTCFFYVPELSSLIYCPQNLSCEDFVKKWLIDPKNNIYIQQIFLYHW